MNGPRVIRFSQSAHVLDTMFWLPESAKQAQLPTTSGARARSLCKFRRKVISER